MSEYECVMHNLCGNASEIPKMILIPKRHRTKKREKIKILICICGRLTGHAYLL